MENRRRVVLGKRHPKRRERNVNVREDRTSESKGDFMRKMDQ